MVGKPLIAGIVAEFNPLHSGHASLIRKVREAGCDAVVVVMSGNFVQRGEPALFYKWPRARAALACGADLVLELPLPWAAAGAERFALGAVSILSALGCVGVLAFGSENGDAAGLQRAAKAVCSPALRPLLRKKLASGIPFAAAREDAVRELFGGETADLLQEPNNILGIEYCKALDRLGSPMRPLAFLRSGSPHDAGGAPDEGEFASSSQIRELILNGRPFSRLVPPEAGEIYRQEMDAGRAPALLKRAETAVLAKMRCMSRGDFRDLPDVSEGLENRIYESARAAVSLEDLYARIKSKRYPLARVRRIVLSAFLGLTADFPRLPPYLRLLGFSEKGRRILNTAKKTASLPIAANVSDILSLDKTADNVFELENRATDLYSLCTPCAEPCGLEMTCACWERKYLFGYSDKRNKL